MKKLSMSGIQKSAECAQREQSTRKYKNIQSACDNSLVTLQHSAILSAETPDENLIQSKNEKIETQVHITHLYQTDIRKYMILTEGIETQQILIGQQLVNQRKENEVAL
jgi:hypothetical protein